MIGHWKLDVWAPNSISSSSDSSSPSSASRTDRELRLRVPRKRLKGGGLRRGRKRLMLGTAWLLVKFSCTGRQQVRAYVSERTGVQILL